MILTLVPRRPSDHPPTVPSADGGSPVSVQEALMAFTARLKPSSLRAYARDLKFWCRATATTDAPGLLRMLVDQGPGRTNLMALRSLEVLKTAGLSPSTLNRRLSALKSVLSAARLVGMITWNLEVRGPKGAVLRDTRGPGVTTVLQMLKCAKEHLDPVHAARDLAILWLLFGTALRVGEVASLSLGDIELDQHRVWVLGKGRDERQPITIPRQVERALASWLTCRGNGVEYEPIFVALDRVHHGHRLTSRSMHRVVVRLGKLAGIRTWPHGLRHSAITAALDAGADVRQVRRFSRHASLDTLLLYDDNREDQAGVVAQKIADLSNVPSKTE